MSMNKKRLTAVILAAGSSTRFGADKIWATACGLPIISYSLSLAQSCGAVDDVILALKKGDEKRFEIESFEQNSEKTLALIEGGETRMDSLAKAVDLIAKRGVESAPDYVLATDAARPFIRQADFDRVAASVKEDCGAFAAMRSHDSLRRVNERGLVVELIERGGVVRAATPQVLPFAKLAEALNKAREKGLSCEDETALAALIGFPMKAVFVSPEAFKITEAADFELARKIAFNAYGAGARAGEGFDVHRFAQAEEKDARPLKLCGIAVNAEMYVSAHSDGDVAAHALMDACLGACGLGDIGGHYGSEDELWENADGMAMLADAVKKCAEAGFEPVNADVTIAAQAPKIAPIRDLCAANLAKAMNIEPRSVNVKATTTEGLGIIGRRQGIACFALAVFKPINKRG